MKERGGEGMEGNVVESKKILKIDPGFKFNYYAPICGGGKQ